MSVKSEHLPSNPQEWRQLQASPFCFYQALGYPIPSDQGTFSCISNISILKEKENWTTSSDYTTFSRKTKNPQHTSFIKKINKYHRLYRNLPFIEQIYLANSVTFNALNTNSDIDIFVITQPKRLRLARFFCSLVMWIMGIKRGKSDAVQKFCLSFFVSSDAQSLEHLLIDENDLYLPYRIAHLSPLYLQNAQATIYKHNQRVQRFLPNRTPKQQIFLGNKVSQGSGGVKSFFEFFFTTWRGDIREELLQKLWSTLIEKKKKKEPDLHQDILFTSSILKFHQDKRRKYSDLIFWK